MIFDARSIFRALQASMGAVALVVVLGQSASAQSADADHPLDGEAYIAAGEAYKAFGQGDYSTAAARAAQSVTLRPDILRLHILLIDSLLAAGDLRQAELATNKASEIFSSDQELLARQANIRQRLAQKPASDGYKALEKGNSKSAIRAARSALAYAPDVMSYRLLLLSAQLADNNLS